MKDETGDLFSCKAKLNIFPISDIVNLNTLDSWY